MPTATMLVIEIFLLATIQAQPHAGIERAGFMAGCWRGDFPSGTIEERYTPPAGGLMLGTTRYLKDGRAVQFEFTHIAEEGETVVLTPYPDGMRSEHAFRMTSSAAGRVVFEAPEHDFPKRVAYHKAPGDSLIARIDGGEGSDQAMEWRMGRIDCDQAP